MRALESPDPAISRGFARPIRTYIILFILALTPLAALGLYARHVAARAVDDLVRSNNQTAAMVTCDLVKREFEHRVNALVGFSQSPGLVEAVRQGDEEAARTRLERLVESQTGIPRAFVTDPEGTLWSDYPVAPESLGQNFAERDWYLGVSRQWQPYVSGVYRRNAEPRLLLVAVAAPIRSEGPTGDVIGILASQVTLEDLSALLREVEVGTSGHVFLLDPAGGLAAHPSVDLQQREHTEYADSAPAREASKQDARTVDYVDPLSGERMLATAVVCEVQGRSWIVAAQQPVAEAYGPVRALGIQIAGAGALLIFVLAGGLFGLARYHNRVERLNAELERLAGELSRENQERRRAENALQEANENLEERVEARTRELRETQEQLLHAQKMEAVGRLAGGVAHDFNNLLTVILGYSRMLLAGADSGSELRASLEEIDKATDRAARLTRQLLAFSRRQTLKPEILDLNGIVAGMDRLLRRLIGEDIDLATKLRPGLRLVKADPGQIEQIIMNLAVNARDAMPKGGKLTIETANVDLDEEYAAAHSEAQVGPHAMIAVSDTGMGMDAETKARIFEPFFTTKELGRGTGLGLSTVYGIVKQSGGNIWVYSEVGRGTTFKVYLPKTDESAPPPAKPPAKPSAARGVGTILVVEDDESVRLLIRRALERGGYTTLDAGDVDEAIELCEQRDGAIDLLLTDVALPKMDGQELAERLMASRPAMKVVFMSGYTDSAIAHHGVLRAGAAFIEKPIAPEALLEKMREVLG